MKTRFEFRGNGLSLLWLFIWTGFVTLITFGLFFPWASTYFMKWAAQNTYIGGRQLVFKGNGLGFFIEWLIIMILTIITLCLYTPWGVCKFYRWISDNIEYADEQFSATAQKGAVNQMDNQDTRFQR